MDYFIIILTFIMVAASLYFAFKSYSDTRKKHYQDYLKRKR
ncbi:hypothetical protein F900_00457 [Acinetobacter modestus]|uniref:Uncharacterized protein n=1 Tax=Acinetobacter modestus TaxID=1776740 RepID=N9M6G5_9GAMM|nr:hypothetical protein F900_00457 [Acinetobacter modestus]